MAATLVESWLPWWTSSSGNDTEATKIAHAGLLSGDPSHGPTSTETTSVWWGEWKFKVLFGWTKIAVFSTPEIRGSLGTDGGWALYFVDKVGVLCFGQYWPLAGWTTLERWICCGGACCHRCTRAPPQVLDPAVQRLPVTPAPSSYSTVQLVGPGCSTPVDTEYFQRQVRGRGAGRRPHALVLRFPAGAARIQPDWSQRSCIDRHGLWVKPGRVLGVTARSLRENLQKAEASRRCRSEECTLEGAYHCKEFAAVDADALIDLGAYGRLNSWRVLLLCWRGLRSVRSGLVHLARCCSCRRSTEASRQIQDQGVIRTLGPDSESEAEVTADPCEAVLIGLELQGKPRALAPEGCVDRAASEPTRILSEDLQLSDLGGRECARLCNHHSQLYMLSCQGRKCSVVSCFSSVHGAHRGTPLCKKHLAETCRAQSLAPVPKSSSHKPEEPLLQSIRRSQSADFKETGPSRTVRFEEQCLSPPRPGPLGPSSEFEPPSRSERASHPKAGVRLRPFFGAGHKSQWFLFEGVAEDSRRTERAAVLVVSLGLRLSLPWRCLGEPHAVASAGRYPRSWLQEFLYSPPQDLEDRGLAVQVTQLALQSWLWMHDWEGLLIPAPPHSVSSFVSCLANLTWSFWLMMKEEFSGAKGPSLEVILAPPGIRKRMATCPPDLDPVALHESFREARAHGSTVSEAVTLVASAYGVNPELVQLSELGLLMPPVVAMGRQTQKFTPGGTALAAAHGRAHVGPWTRFLHWEPLLGGQSTTWSMQLFFYGRRC